MDTSREYSIYVCEQRAIPQITDGLKSSQRKMLWVIRNKKEKIKTISLAGEAISEGLYLHGDQSASQAISMLAAPYANNVPLLTGIGSFGSLTDPYSIGAPRYTYVKKNIFTEKILYADLDLVPLVENYDGSNLEPKHFLPLVPLVLLNGVSGIAVGWATEILPRNLNDLIDAVVAVLESKDFETPEPKYDYLDIVTKKIDTNVWEFYGKIEKNDNSSIVVKSLPPETTLEKFKEKLDSLEEEGKIQEYVDNSSEKIDILVKFKRGTLSDYNEEKILDLLKLRTRKTERIVVIDFDGNSVKQYDSAKDLIIDWVSWRIKFYYSRYEKLIAELEDEIEYLISLKKCFEENFLENIKICKNKKEVLNLIQNIVGNISEKNIEKISQLPTYKWNNEYYKEVLNEIEEKCNKILEYQEILNDHSKIKNIYKSELEETRKYFEKYKVEK